MASETGNPFAGHWQDGVGLVERRNPSDISDVIGQYAQDSAVDAAYGARPEWRRRANGSGRSQAPTGLTKT